MRYWDRVLKALTGKKGYAAVHRFISDADSVFSGYIRGQLMDAVIMCIMISLALSLVKVPFAVIIGLMTGIGNLIPYVGPFIAYACTVVVCLMNWDIRKLVISLVVLFIIQTLDGNVINPKLLSSSISVHPMLVIVALIIGGAVGGFLGMLLAVPVAALAKIWFDRGVEKLSERRDRIESGDLQS
jgi:predicted PurR-regulated permease PerM